MPENICKNRLIALILLGLTGVLAAFFAYPRSAEAASIVNLSGASQTLQVLAAGKDFKPVTIATGKTITIGGDAVVRYRNFNIRMGDNQQLSLLKNGGFRLETVSGGGGGNDEDNGDDGDGGSGDGDDSGGVSI